MRKGRMGVAAALLLGLAVSVAAAAGEGDGDAEGAPARKGTWFPGWFGHGKAEEKKAAAQAEKPPPGPSPADLAAVERQRELNAYFRRMAVCDRLREIAQDKDDQEMERQLEQLEQRNWEVYQQRTAGLPSGAGQLDLDEASLGRHLEGERAPARALTAPKPAAGRGDSRAASLGEERP